MGLFHEIKKGVHNVGHAIDKGIDHAFEVANSYGHKWFGGGPGHEDEGGTDWYVGYNSNNGFQGYINPGQTSYTPKPRPNSGYSRTTAATAKDIAQGGMTKDEVIEFNMKHPNETAKRSE